MSYLTAGCQSMVGSSSQRLNEPIPIGVCDGPPESGSLGPLRNTWMGRVVLQNRPAYHMKDAIVAGPGASFKARALQHAISTPLTEFGSRISVFQFFFHEGGKFSGARIYLPPGAPNSQGEALTMPASWRTFK